MKHLDLFSGIGGFALACEWAGIETIGFVEIDKYCQKVLRKNFPDVPIVEDIRDVKRIKEIVANAKGGAMRNDSKDLRPTNREIHASINASLSEPSRAGGEEAIKEIVANATGGRLQQCEVWREAAHDSSEVDTHTRTGTILRTQPAILVTAGFPCQPFSVAGKRGGKEDDRYLWPQTIAVIEAVKPTWVLLENVAGIIPMALDTVLSDLEGAGYSWETVIIPACAVNAPHRRDRIWIVAHYNGQRCRDTLERYTEVRLINSRDKSAENQARENWAVEPRLGRVAHGIPNRVDRLKCLGNAIVPQVAYEIIRAIKEVDENTR